MEIDPCSMPPSAIYKLLIGCIVPRPIAWVSTASADGAHNVAPFSLTILPECSDVNFSLCVANITVAPAFEAPLNMLNMSVAD